MNQWNQSADWGWIEVFRRNRGKVVSNWDACLDLTWASIINIKDKVGQSSEGDEFKLRQAKVFSQLLLITQAQAQEEALSL